MNIKDGNIFEVMRIILPEHREMMERQKQEAAKQPRPVITEDEFEQMQYTMSEALENQALIRVILYHPYGHKIINGIPEIIDGKLYLQTEEGKTQIPTQEIIKVEYPFNYD